MQRFWENVTRTETCWLWTAGKQHNGYGRFHHTATATIAAHKFSWIEASGAVPAGLFVLHKCDVRACVNPDHLFLGTKLDNKEDMIAKDRDCYGERVHCHKLTAAQVVSIREEYAAGGITHRELGARYGVRKETIGKVVRFRNWKKV